MATAEISMNAARVCPIAAFLETWPLVLTYGRVYKNAAIDPSVTDKRGPKNAAIGQIVL